MQYISTLKRLVQWQWYWLCWLLLPLVGRAQAPAWQQALALNGQSMIQATAVNAAGDVFVTGYYVSQLTVGSTTLRNAGSWDMFVAKWSATTADWVWVVGGGGTNTDSGIGIAVSGNNVYVTGSVYNNSSNANAVTFGGVAVNGLAAAAGTDAFVVKYTDLGSSAAYGWIVLGGGTGGDRGSAIATSGTALYVTGNYANTSANSQAVQVGGIPLNGFSTLSGYDIFTAKFTDIGPSAVCNWAVGAGGTSNDGSTAIAVNGSSVYITGGVPNSSANSRNVQFGGVVLPGASSTESFDMFVAKYTDTGSQAICNWAVSGGGTGYDQGQGIAVSGTSVYVTGAFVNNNSNVRGVQFGGATLNGASTANDQDAFIVKYTDAGSQATYNWAVAGGGISSDSGSGIAADGTSVYITGTIINNNANAQAVQFGGVALSGASSSSGYDIFVAKYVDAGSAASFAWATAGGGPLTDYGYGILVSKGRVGVGGLVLPPATFGSLSVTSASTSPNVGVLLWLPTTVLPVRSSQSQVSSPAYPNPATDILTVQVPGEIQATQVQATLLNALGQVVYTQTATLPATGTKLLLNVGALMRGVYLLQLKTGASLARQQVVLE